MRKLTFVGFLVRSLRELSGQDSLRISWLARQAEAENSRLREPLLLYAAMTGSLNILLAALRDDALKAECARLLTLGNIAALLRGGDRRLPESYRGVYQSYQGVRDRQADDDRVKQLLWQRIKEFQGKKRVSNYRVYTDLQLNPGNMNAFLTHGDVSKISLSTARKVLRYLEASGSYAKLRRTGARSGAQHRKPQQRGDYTRARHIGPGESEPAALQWELPLLFEPA